MYCRYKDNINAKMNKQIEKGYKEYGLLLENSTLSTIETLEYLQEELIDSLFYTEKIIEKLYESQGNDYNEKNRV